MSSYIVEPIEYWQRSHVVQYVLLWNKKKLRRIWLSIKKYLMDIIWAGLENPITKYLWKKVRAVITTTFLNDFFILSTLLSSAVWSLVKCKSLEGSDKASRVYSRRNVSNS